MFTHDQRMEEQLTVPYLIAYLNLHLALNIITKAAKDPLECERKKSHISHLLIHQQMHHHMVQGRD